MGRYHSHCHYVFLKRCVVVGGDGGGGVTILDVSSAVRGLGCRGASHSLKNAKWILKQKKSTLDPRHFDQQSDSFLHFDMFNKHFEPCQSKSLSFFIREKKTILSENPAERLVDSFVLLRYKHPTSPLLIISLQLR